MDDRMRRGLFRYGVALLTTAITTAMRAALQPLIGGEVPLLSFVLSVTLAAWLGGFGPGVVATAASVLAGVYLFFEPRFTFAINDAGDRVHVVMFAVSGLCISLVSGRMRAALARQRRAEREREALLASERAARSEAERASQMKDDFVAMVSHELRTPLTSILGWAQILRDRPASPEVRRGLEVIERNAQLQTRLVSDLLDVSRIVSGKTRLEIGPADLPAIVEAAMASVRREAEAKQIELHAALDPTGAQIIGDPARLEQIFWNLLSNAVKFTPRGGRVDVRLSRDDDRAVIVVADNGEGIPLEALPLIFDRFRQADSSRARRHGGLGLGLAIVKHYVELHGGAVRAASDGSRKGATFTVELPVRGPEDRAERAHGEIQRPLDLEGVSVLAVEDEADALELVKRLLEERRATVITARSADEALDVLRTVTPDVIVSDIGMPGKDGYALIREIRTAARDAVRLVPAVALTAFAREEDRDQALSHGYQAHLTKPIRPVELTATLVDLARKPRPRPSEGP